MNRIEALTNVSQDPSRSQAEKEIAARALRSASGALNASTDAEPASAPYQELSPDSQAMLLALGKRHLRDVAQADLERYTQHFGTDQKQQLCTQWRAWVRPDDDFLDLIGMSATNYWRAIYDHAKSDDVRMNALVEMRKERQEQ